MTRVDNGWLSFMAVLFSLAALAPPTAVAQTVSGRLLDAQAGSPIDLGILVLLTEAGDTAALTATDPTGRFVLTAAEPGSFFVQASAWGYISREDGLFELGPGARIDVEFPIAPRPIDLEGILVTTDRPRPDHPLVENGFVRRYRSGVGYFITPRDLERTVHLNTESLFHFVPGVRVRTSPLTSGTGAFVGNDIDRVLIRGPFGGWCPPAVFIDDMRTPYDPDLGDTISQLIPVGQVAAVEVYRGQAETPPQYGGAASGTCGVLVFWTKR